MSLFRGMNAHSGASSCHIAPRGNCELPCPNHIESSFSKPHLHIVVSGNVSAKQPCCEIEFYYILRKQSDALVPPKPKLFDIATLMSFCCASFAT